MRDISIFGKGSETIFLDEKNKEKNDS